MDWLTNTLTILGQPTSGLELLATLLSAVCVYMVVKRNVFSYPVGILGTILFFFVFKKAGLESSANLQIFFTFVQGYGWWFWLYGDKGKVPKISQFIRGASQKMSLLWALLVIGIMGLVSVGLGMRYADGSIPMLNAQLDAMIFGVSVLAQLGMDRKKLEHWVAWILVDIVSIGHYWNMGLPLTSLLYVLFLGMATWGLVEWRRVYRKERNDALLSYYSEAGVRY
jgi:nicotinamide mononucleotide transporter